MRNDLPNDKASNFNARLRETVMTYLGKQGDPLDRGVTLRDLVESGIVELSGGRIGSSPVPLTPGEALTPGGALGPGANDLTPPPAPSGLTVTAGLTTIIVEHDSPTYNWGNGHLRTRLYGKIRNVGDPAPTFNDAAEIAQFTGQVYAYPTPLGTTWHLWAKWESNNEVLSQPAGGTNGLVAATGLVGTSDLSNAVITAAKIVDGSINLGGSKITGLLANANMAVISDPTKIADSLIGNTKLANLAVDAAKLANSSVTATKIANLAVGTAAIQTGSITTALIANAAIGSAQIADAAITSAKIGTASIGAAAIQDLAVTNAKIANLAIDSAKIASMTADKITAGSIAVGQHIQSAGYVSGSAGWRIDGSGSAEFSNVTVRGSVVGSTITGGTITGSVITGATLQTAASGQRIVIDTSGLLFLTGTTFGKYGTFKYGTTRKYGGGVLVYFNNATKRVPFYVAAEQNVADIHLYNRGADPTGATYEAGDMICVNGRLKIFVPALGGWKTLALEP
jgi:hypothetical protein